MSTVVGLSSVVYLYHCVIYCMEGSDLVPMSYLSGCITEKQNCFHILYGPLNCSVEDIHNCPFQTFYTVLKLSAWKVLVTGCLAMFVSRYLNCKATS